MHDPHVIVHIEVVGEVSPQFRKHYNYTIIILYIVL